ncbi:MAG TPA: DUF3995 domain-containing protein [Reyranella sp.]|jgi:hypothetical protein
MIWLAAGLSAALVVIAAFHAYWGLGGIWPKRTAADLARVVVGDGRTRMPPPWACFTVAALLLIVAAWPWVFLAQPDSEAVLVVGIVAAAIFFVRGMAGFSPRWRQHFSAEPFATWDMRLYSPLCMALATGIMALLAKGM